jgi:membrane-bound serine protease (ClpP class)
MKKQKLGIIKGRYQALLLTGERPMKRYKLVLVTLIICLLLSGAGTVLASQSNDVYVIPVTGIVDRGLAAFVNRGITEAEKNMAKAIVIEIDTPGGEVEPAINISSSILNASVPTLTLIKDEATSAGVIIAISSNKIYMTSHATIGAAETRPKEEKYISYWSSKLRGVAEKTGRDPELVAAMADSDIVIEGIKPKGKILSLTAKQALEVGLADSIVANRHEALSIMGIDKANIQEIKPNVAEHVARFVTNPYISPIILTIGIVGAIMELLTPGFGIFGFLGLLAFGLFFGANFMIGAAQYWALGLFILGLVLLLIEMFIPGFGVFGISGIVSVILGLVMSFPNPIQAIYSLSFSIIASVVILYFSIKYLVKTPVFDKLILSLKQDKTQGYLSSSQDKSTYCNREGVALTTLRPAGAGEFDGVRVDVITDGEYIPAGSRIKVIKVEGSKVVVRKLKEEV